MIRKERNLLKEQLYEAVEKVLMANRLDLNSKLEKEISKSVKKIIKRTD